MDECNLIHLQSEESALGLIDFSSENDSLVFDDDSSPHNHYLPSENWKEPQNIDLFDLMNDVEEAITDERINQIEHLPNLSESSDPIRVTRMGKYNLRKSLAWDSAFFTNAGVLDPEELSGMIGETERSRNQVLPRIIEDIGGSTENIEGSTDSISTLGSENLTAHNFEAELFEDIRASVQKFSEKLDAPGYHEVSKKSPTLPAGKKIDLATQNQVKLKTALKKPDVMSKAIPKQNLRIQRPVKTTKQVSALSEVTKSVRIADSTTATTKTPPIIGKGRFISTLSVKRDSKRDSLVAAQSNKNENDKLKTSTCTSKGAQDIKAASSIGARRTLPKPAPSSKSSSIVSLSRLKTESARSSTDSSGSYPSDSTAKSSVAVSRRKVGDRPLKPPSGSTLKTPIKSAINNRTATRSYAPSAYLKSSKISSGVSPASSISEWSSASSTSSSTINGKFNKSRTSFDASPCHSLDNGRLSLDLDCPSDHMLDGCEHRASDSQKISSTRPVALAHPASAKPSGLRMPSPSIGFFDGVKSARTPNGSAQPHHSDSPSLSKSGAVVCRPAKLINNKAKVGKCLNTQKPPQVMAPEVITHDSDDGPTEAKDSPSSPVKPNHVINVPSDGNMDVLTGSKNDPNIIAINTHTLKPEYKESLLIYRKEDIVAKDAENDLEEDIVVHAKFDQEDRGVLEEQRDEVH